MKKMFLLQNSENVFEVLLTSANFMRHILLQNVKNNFKTIPVDLNKYSQSKRKFSFSHHSRDSKSTRIYHNYSFGFDLFFIQDKSVGKIWWIYCISFLIYFYASVKRPGHFFWLGTKQAFFRIWGLLMYFFAHLGSNGHFK